MRQGLPKTQIAKAVGIAHSTLYLELARGTTEQLDSELRIHRTYLGDVGQRVYEENRKNSRPPLRVKNIDLPLRVKRKQKSARIRRQRRCYGDSIDMRHAEVEKRNTFGHWKIDTVIGCTG